MFIYILNILNDTLRNNAHDNNYLPFEIISDTKYISELGGINRSSDFIIIKDRLNNVIERLIKYNLSLKNTIHILNKLLLNKNNTWILNSFYNYELFNKKGSLNLIISSIVSEIQRKNGAGDSDAGINYITI